MTDSVNIEPTLNSGMRYEKNRHTQLFKPVFF